VFKNQATPGFYKIDGFSDILLREAEKRNKSKEKKEKDV
jgi:hypothetical protein